jgi:hypothetical protein
VAGRHYVYTFRDANGVPIWVGKGADGRFLAHPAAAAWLDGMELVTVEIRFVPDSITARKIEAQLIKQYGRKIDGGTLFNQCRNTELAYVEEIIELRKVGGSVREIARHLSMDRSSVSKVAQRAGYGGRIASRGGPRRHSPPLVPTQPAEEPVSPATGTT